MKPLASLTALSLALLLAGCASLPPPAPPQPSAPAQWANPLPHQGSAVQLQQWWQAFGDAELLALIERAQAANPTLAQSAARVAQARAEARAGQAALLPRAELQASSVRSQQAPTFQPSTLSGANLSATWEIDLFGGQRAESGAAQQRARAAELDWHAARVSLAAEVAQAYLGLRHAQAQEEVGLLDTRATAALLSWAQLQRKAGLIAETDLALVATQHAAAQIGLATQQAEVQLALQTLATLTDTDVAQLRTRLAATPAGITRPQRKLLDAPPFELDTLPAALLAQRPDLQAAHAQWAAALLQSRAADAQSYPQLSLGALIGPQRLEVGGTRASGTFWQLMPSLSLPLFNGGAIAAQQQAASARADEAAAALQARWRAALGEVEDALTLLHAEQQRRTLVEGAVQQWLRIADNADVLGNAGLQSGPQRAATLRQALAGYSAALAVRHAHASSWIRLYRVLGGGWTA